MLPLYLSLKHKDPGFSPGFFPAIELDGCFKQKAVASIESYRQPWCINLLLYICVIDFWVKTGMLLPLQANYLKANCNSCG